MPQQQPPGLSDSSLSVADASELEDVDSSGTLQTRRGSSATASTPSDLVSGSNAWTSPAVCIDVNVVSRMLRAKDVQDQIIQLTPEAAMERRNKRWLEAGGMENRIQRSETRRLNDARRIHMKNTSPKGRKSKPLRCPDPDCDDPDPHWASEKSFQNHLGEHDIKMFICRLCGHEYPRKDNLIHHLLHGKTHSDYRRQRQRELASLKLSLL